MKNHYKGTSVFKNLLMAAWLALSSLAATNASAPTSITALATPSSTTAPANITLSIVVTNDPDQVTITQVEYYNGTQSLGVSTTAPFTLELTSAPAATYRFVAKATLLNSENPVLLSEATTLIISNAAAVGQNMYYVQTDQLNTPRAITDQSSTLVWACESDPFGSRPPTDTPGAAAQFSFNQRFAGQYYYDKETNLSYNYYRDYDPALGRYVQSDPLGLRGGVNTYGYVGGNPILYSDPTGLINIPGIPGAEGETTVNANPGPEASDFRPEHGPDHVHLGANDGPRVRTSDFKPFSKEDELKMSRKQKKFCENLAETSKNKIRKAQQSIFKHGKIILQLQAGGMISIAAACRNDPVWCAEQIESGVLP